ncbi:uncharacterized protein [Oscarella lobularis]|uniref:uncharacterized protein isoform X2 n=1 Tax=Oscarella lobularis TaxID=121494 RepID=UPI00331337B3
MADDDAQKSLVTFDPTVDEIEASANVDNANDDDDDDDDGEPNVFTANEARDMMTILDRVEASVGALRTHIVEQDSQPTRKRPRLPTWITNNLLILTLVWQVACVVALTVIELADHVPDKKLVKDRTYIVGVVILAIFQGLNLLLVIFSSVKLAKQIMHHTASSRFLIQSYMSTLLLFAGLYTLIFRLNNEAITGIPNTSKEEKSILIIELFLWMIYYSASNATLCGSANVHPVIWYSIIFSIIQMVLSFAYFASILSEATSHHRRPDHQRRPRGNSTRSRGSSFVSNSHVESLSLARKKRKKAYGSTSFTGSIQ